MISNMLSPVHGAWIETGPLSVPPRVVPATRENTDTALSPGAGSLVRGTWNVRTANISSEHVPPFVPDFIPYYF